MLTEDEPIAGVGQDHGLSRVKLRDNLVQCPRLELIFDNRRGLLVKRLRGRQREELDRRKDGCGVGSIMQMAQCQCVAINSEGIMSGVSKSFGVKEHRAGEDLAASPPTIFSATLARPGDGVAPAREREEVHADSVESVNCEAAMRGGPRNDRICLGIAYAGRPGDDVISGLSLTEHRREYGLIGGHQWILLRSQEKGSIMPRGSTRKGMRISKPSRSIRRPVAPATPEQ